MRLSWGRLIKHLAEHGPGIKVKVPKDRIEHPLKVGFRKSIGLHFYRKNYRLALPDGSCVHVEETKDHYIVHVDVKDPGLNPIDHLRQDAPGLWAALWAGVGLSAGAIVGAKNGKQRGLMSVLGAIAGLIIGFLTGRWGRK